MEGEGSVGRSMGMVRVVLTSGDTPQQVLKWEDQILQFMRAGSKQLDFPPLSSYHRLIIHRLAQRFSLDHIAIDPSSSGHYLDPNANRCVHA